MVCNCDVELGVWTLPPVTWQSWDSLNPILSVIVHVRKVRGRAPWPDRPAGMCSFLLLIQGVSWKLNPPCARLSVSQYNKGTIACSGQAGDLPPDGDIITPVSNQSVAYQAWQMRRLGSVKIVAELATALHMNAGGLEWWLFKVCMAISVSTKHQMQRRAHWGAQMIAVLCPSHLQPDGCSLCETMIFVDHAFACGCQMTMRTLINASGAAACAGGTHPGAFWPEVGGCSRHGLHSGCATWLVVLACCPVYPSLSLQPGYPRPFWPKVREHSSPFVMHMCKVCKVGSSSWHFYQCSSTQATPDILLACPLHSWQALVQCLAALLTAAVPCLCLALHSGCRGIWLEHMLGVRQGVSEFFWLGVSSCLCWLPYKYQIRNACIPVHWTQMLYHHYDFRSAMACWPDSSCTDDDTQMNMRSMSQSTLEMIDRYNDSWGSCTD